ncbi:MAG: hypothetical protein JWP89_2861 [Schlesneria sp.]|nr:hypothetical protein [Schlesneria sp.]
MHQPIRVVIFNAILFVVLVLLGATLQTWSGWHGFFATGIAMLPAFVFAWSHLPDRSTPDRFPADEACLLYVSILGTGFVIVDVLHLRPNIWVCFAASCCLIAFHKIGKWLVIRSDSAADNSSKS